MKPFGQDLSVLSNQLIALFLNLYAWLCRLIWKRRRSCPTSAPSCISISGPGGLDMLEVQHIEDRCTVGYNVSLFKKGSLFADLNEDRSNLPEGLVIVKVSHFSVNYADIAIRWGLYESALRYVGWPICPGFDLSGTVEFAGTESTFKAGDKVFGFSMFGAYSSRVVVPQSQIRPLPENLSLEQGAAIPAVAATALHALSLSGGWPGQVVTANKAALIHSAAGGVGSMLVQMCKAQGYSPVVAVIGSASKADYCGSMGADFVIIKEKSNIWSEAKRISPEGYVAIFDANGVETLGESYNHLARCGRLITYGFHSNLPKSDILSPAAWISLIYGLFVMPKFDPMNMVVDSKSVLGFNLSFFAEEHELISTYMRQILEWIASGKIKSPDAKLFEMNEISLAHQTIQSGLSVGKIVLKAC